MRSFSANVRRSFRLHASECFDLPALKASSSLDEVTVDELREDNSTLSMSIDGREGTLHALNNSSKAQKSLCMVHGVQFTSTEDEPGNRCDEPFPILIMFLTLIFCLVTCVFE